MSVKLSLASGSLAGVEELLKHGFYMIGRDQECQIRPHSHSVSRKHCLLHFSGRGVRVFDLASANGTHVNEQELKPNQWVWLSEGDTLRCGQVVFDVSVKASNAAQTTAKPSSSITATSQPVVPQGRNPAWKDFDIVSFLEAEDEAERQMRHALRQNHGRCEVPAKNTTAKRSSARSHEVTSIDLVGGDKEAQAVLAEARDRAARKTGRQVDDPDSPLSLRARRIAALRAKIEAERCSAERNEAIKRTLSQNGRVIDRPLPRSSVQKVPTVRKMKAARPQPTAIRLESKKLYAAVFVSLLFGGVFVYSVYQTAVGTPAQIIQEID